MILFLQIVFFVCLGGVLATYLFYPLYLRFLGTKDKSSSSPAPMEELPSVEVLFAAHNEEAVLAERLQNLLASDYPPAQITIRVGSDNSTDGTNEILQAFAKKHPQVAPYYFEQRQGKANILNHLVAEAEADLLVFTDANILFAKETLRQLVQSLQNSRAGACGGVIHYHQTSDRGISRQENDYLNWENQLKQIESSRYGLCMGLEGGCYILRRALFPHFPTPCLVDDFYLTMHLLENRQPVLFNPQIRAYEDATTLHQVEYRRKVRISIGNFQNLGRFKHLIWHRWRPLGFCFFFHKVLRWFTPFFMLLLLISSMLLFKTASFFALFNGFYMLFIGLGLFGILFSQQQKGGWLKYPGHFLYMNLALMEGFFLYLNGDQSNVWQPTARNSHKTG